MAWAVSGTRTARVDVVVDEIRGYQFEPRLKGFNT